MIRGTPQAIDKSRTKDGKTVILCFGNPEPNIRLER